jgi:phospholipase/carboxylesterase
MNLKCLEAQTSDTPDACVIVMHGLGAGADDFAPFVREIPLPNTRWVFPQAPDLPVSINGGFRMPAWYDIRVDRSDEDAAGLHASAAAIGAVIDAQVARGIPTDRIVIGGFSQGCAMSLLTGLRLAKPLAGILGMSGYLPLASDYAKGKAAGEFAANAAAPIYLAHGTQDPMIEIARARTSRDQLSALGHAIEWHEYPMPHSVCAEEVADITAWLRRVLNKG